MYVCVYVCLYVCVYLRMYVCKYVSMYVCVCVCMYVRMSVCMYVCMPVCRLRILRLPRKDFHEISRLKFLLKFVNIPILINIGQKKTNTVYEDLHSLWSLNVILFL